MKSNIDKRGLILLNTPCDDSKFIELVWKHSHVRICADGGANRLYNLNIPTLIPNVIVGDMDSIKKETLLYYKNNVNGKCEILNQSDDQDTTDLDKALKVAHDKFKCNDIVILGQFCNSNRFDHSFGIIQSLFKYQTTLTNEKENNLSKKSAIVISDNSLMQLILPIKEENNDNNGGRGGSNDKIVIDDTQWKTHHIKAIKGSHCGIIPIAGKCEIVKTEGLKYNLIEGQSLEFGHLISTSNLVMSDDVYITTNKPLLWTMTVPNSP